MSDSVLTSAAALRAAVAALDPAVLSGSDCARLANELARTEKVCGAARLRLSARAVQTGAHREQGFPDGAAWVASQSGMTPGAARRELATVGSLERCPDTQAAWLGGEISVAQAGQIVDAEGQTPGAEAVLLAEARAGDLSQVRDRARQHRQEALDPAELRAHQFRARRFRHWQDRDGMVCFEGALPPERGVPLVNRIRQTAERAWRAARADRADQAAPGDRTARDGKAVLDPFDAFSADALCELVGGAGRHAEGPETPVRSVDTISPATPGRVASELIVVCDLYAWRRGHIHPGEVCHIIDGGPIPVSVARDLAGDAFVKGVLHDGIRIVAVKHFGRHIPSAVRTALDLGPVPAFSGRQCVDCGRRYGLEYDHIDPVAHRGPTSYDNLAARCWPDHQAKTRRDRQAGLLGPNPPPPP